MTHCQRQGKVKVTHGQCLQSDRAWHITATTNHTLSYKVNRAVQIGQLEMHKRGIELTEQLQLTLG